MRALVLSTLVALSGCLVSHQVDAIPTAYDHVQADPTQTRRVKACTFGMLYAVPISGPRGHELRHYRVGDMAAYLQQQGATAHVVSDTIHRSWLIGSSTCTHLTGQAVPASVLFEEE